jgi:hypothetical protein
MIPILTGFFVKLFRLGSSTGPLITSGTGNPEGVVAAPIGSIYLRDDGGTDSAVYRKESGVAELGWVAVSAGVGLSSGASTEVEIDFGYPMKKSKKFTVAEGISTLNAWTVIVQQSSNAATGKSIDENEMDQLHFTARPKNGFIDIYVTCLSGKVGGKFKIYYTLAPIIIP